MKNVPLSYRLLAAAAVLLVIAVCAVTFASPTEALVWLSTGALATGYLMRDALLKKTHALPNGAATTQGAGIDLGLTSRADFTCPHEVLITAPALTVGECANGDTVTYQIEHDTSAGFGGAVVLLDKLIVQTGAGGVGAAAATFRVPLPTNVKQFIRLKTVKTGTGNATTKSATIELLF